MMTYQASVEMVPRKVDSFPSQLEHIAKDNGGYIQSHDIHSQLWSTTEIKVLSTKLEGALHALTPLGKTLSQNIRHLDVDDEHKNITIRLENATRARKRYFEILNMSTSVEDIIKIEKELQRLNIDIERYEDELSRLDQEISYALITVRYRKKQKPGILGYVFAGLYKSVKWLIIRDY